MCKIWIKLHSNCAWNHPVASHYIQWYDLSILTSLCTTLFLFHCETATLTFMQLKISKVHSSCWSILFDWNSVPLENHTPYSIIVFISLQTSPPGSDICRKYGEIEFGNSHSTSFSWDFPSFQQPWLLWLSILLIVWKDYFFLPISSSSYKKLQKWKFTPDNSS